MPQRPKDQVRRAIVTAARRQLAERGLPQTRLAEVAAEAGTSIGNLYKYFENKQALFAAAIPEERLRELRALLARRMSALGDGDELDALAATHPYRLLSEDSVRFAIAHRHELLFVLRRAQGSPYEGFAERLSRELARRALDYAARVYPEFAVTARRRRALVRIYRGFVDAMAAILAEEKSPRGLRAAAAAHTRYHLAGLRALFRAGPEPRP
ncbi:TetR/AcrR family transcriptional regulator [Haliangium ochraceum]|uniref:Transcriptional regulator, TetR family n=1 Tax=Haliangium ochraceum (strain DSM 14365 / JCM 11303 / SMP-2) TaxID=502025 RepID=D0LMF4_HALO1|nr:TetR/AcrR family transcriptional regulator [Haliangium ochraceum]ACY16860.1 transcriptional regulator, TetR family [Haliangium ochraceum DSM 14365]